MNNYVITLDIDWAPDFVIDHIAEELIQREIKATWFVTHESEAIKKLLNKTDLFECGIHPNFLKNSTHGNSEKEILDYIVSIVPGAKVMRTHSLVQSTPLLRNIVDQYKIMTDASLFLPGASNLEPHQIYFDHKNEGMIRVPYFFEDDIEMYNPSKSWDIRDQRYHHEGLKVFNFHPLFLYLNGDTMHQYEELKAKGQLNEIPKEVVDQFVNSSGEGCRDLFLGLCDFIKNNNHSTNTLSEIVKVWKDKKGL